VSRRKHHRVPENSRKLIKEGFEQKFPREHKYPFEEKMGQIPLTSKKFKLKLK
jgi:hypothetical protein